MKIGQYALLLIYTTLYLISCTPTKKSYTLNDAQKVSLIQRLEVIAETDQLYRKMISIGTMDTAILAKDAYLRKKRDVRAYIAFTKTIKKTLTPNQIDSLTALQDEIDYQNYQSIKSIIKEYGYPSRERLGLEKELIYLVLLHPPAKIKPRDYLEEMVTLLTPEVKAQRMDALDLASFYDNIKIKVMGETQLYGTNRSFNTRTMTEGLPAIQDITVTNKARKAIGLVPLKEGEYQLQNQ